MAIASLVFSLLGLSWAGVIAGPIAIILGAIARKKMRGSGNFDGSGMALAGIIVGAIACVIAVILFLMLTNR